MESCLVFIINERKEEELRRKRDRKVEVKLGSEEKLGVQVELGIDLKLGSDVKGMLGRVGFYYNKE